MLFLIHLRKMAEAPVGRWLSPCFRRPAVACVPLFPALLFVLFAVLLLPAAQSQAADLPSQALTNNTPEPVYDTDDDGLIDITTLAQLDAMRHDLDGDGTPTTAGATAYAAAFSGVTRVVCGATSGGCEGYELMADLDFLDTNGDGQVDTDDDTNMDGQVDAEDTAYWNNGAGWQPMGTSSNRFTTTFEGNDRTISNLFINRPRQDRVGFIGNVSQGRIHHIGLINVQVSGGHTVGGLVGFNYSSGTVMGSYVTGRVSGHTRDGSYDRHLVAGGLVGTNYGTIRTSYATGRVSGGNSVGGLVGVNQGPVMASYATGGVSGLSYTGGLVGANNGTIRTSYATGGVSGDHSAGGLVGVNQGPVMASYATGRVSGNDKVGGLVGWNTAGTTTASYWDTHTSGQRTSDGGTGKTPTELQTPTDASGIYASWNANRWDFGTSSQYPVLKGDFDGDGSATWQEFGHQLRTSPPQAVTLHLSDTSISEDGTKSSTVTATLDQTLDTETIVTVSVSPVAPATMQDFQQNGTTLRIPAEMENSNGAVIITASNNNVDAPDKTVEVNGSGSNSAHIIRVAAATLTITDDDPPEVMGEDAPEYVEGETKPVATYTASNPANVGLRWTVTGPDAGEFRIDQTGRLFFRTSPDYEAPPNKEYAVTVQASDGTLTGELPVMVTVADAVGMVRLPTARPQVGRALTAEVDDLDEPAPHPHPTISDEWCWERFPTFPPGATTEIACTATTSGTYTPVHADLGQYLRVTVTYTDGQATRKAMSVQDETDESVVPAPAHSLSSPSDGGSGSGGGGGGGGGACTQADVHGNSAAQATALALDTPTAGAICPAADVDYFTVTAPGQGLLFVEAPGSVALRGTLWQDGVVVAAGPTGSGQPPTRLGARVQAGPVVVAVYSQGGAPGAYSLAVSFVRGYLENPGADSFQSGVSVLSGWVCAANQVEIELGDFPSQVAAYGTERADTEAVCGDTDNGFGLLFNWNRLGEGEHEVVAYVDGVVLGRTTVTVTTLGAEFVRDVEGECVVEDFPMVGETVTVAWQQTQQNFVLVDGEEPSGENRAGMSGVGYLENPGPNSFQSGIGVISGWVCEGDAVEIALNGVRQLAAYGTERLDTEAVCGDTDNGFGLLFNWNRLGEGEHEVVAFVDGEELGRATVRVTTVGEGAEEEFVRGVAGECTVEDFPSLDETVLLEWQQNSQNFVITDVE